MNQRPTTLFLLAALISGVIIVWATFSNDPKPQQSAPAVISSQSILNTFAELSTYTSETTHMARRSQLKPMHPNFDHLLKSYAFHDWAETQPLYVQAWIYDELDSHALADMAIELYEFATPTLASSR